jgi:hypothetical protein
MWKWDKLKVWARTVNFSDYFDFDERIDFADDEEPVTGTNARTVAQESHAHLLDRKIENVFAPEKRDRNLRCCRMLAGQRFGERPKLAKHG